MNNIDTSIKNIPEKLMIHKQNKQVEESLDGVADLFNL